MNTELSSILAQPNRVLEWANKISYKVDLTPEDKEISGAVDAWIREVVGRTGCDANHEISQMILRTITPEVVMAPSIVLEAAFRQASNISEFDDITFEVAPKNTIAVYDSVPGGNVDRSFVDFKVMTPTWHSLQAETDVSLQEIRRGGYRTVANLVTFIRDAMEAKKISLLLAAIDAACVDDTDQYIEETGNMPTDTSMKAMSLYLHDVMDDGTPIAIMLNKYKQAINGLSGTTTYLTDTRNDQFSGTGFISEYAGIILHGFSGQKKLGDGSLVVPDKKIFGIAGPVGEVCTRGDTNVYQETDINSEKIHIKVNGYTFGYALTEPEKCCKIVMAS